MSNSRKFPPVITPTLDLQSIHTAFLQLKQLVEILTGQRDDVNPNRTFVSDTTPTADNIGDLWVIPNQSSKMYYWNGSQWVDVTV